METGNNGTSSDIQNDTVNSLPILQHNEKTQNGPAGEKSNIRDLLISIKGPVPDNVTTLEDIREERWKIYNGI